MNPNETKILISNSADRKAKTIREAVLKCCGSYEQRGAGFRVEARDVSACWSEAEKNERTRHLNTAGDLHHHPPGGNGFAGQDVLQNQEILKESKR